MPDLQIDFWSHARRMGIERAGGEKVKKWVGARPVTRLMGMNPTQTLPTLERTQTTYDCTPILSC